MHALHRRRLVDSAKEHGIKVIPWFEATVDGDYDFLNTQKYLSSAPGVGGGGVSITFYDRN